MTSVFWEARGRHPVFTPSYTAIRVHNNAQKLTSASCARIRDCLCFTYYEDIVNSALSRDADCLKPGKRVENIGAWVQLLHFHRCHRFYTEVM